MPKPTTIRKTVSFPVTLVDVIATTAVAEHRSFSSQVVKVIRDFFCKQASDATTTEKP